MKFSSGSFALLAAVLFLIPSPVQGQQAPQGIELVERVASYNVAYVLAFRGEADRAFEWLDKAVLYNVAGLTSVAMQPWFNSTRDDPRWLSFLERIDQSPAQLAAIEFNVRLPD